MLNSEKNLEDALCPELSDICPEIHSLCENKQHVHLTGHFGLAFSGKVHMYAKEVLKNNFPRDLHAYFIHPCFT